VECAMHNSLLYVSSLLLLLCLACGAEESLFDGLASCEPCGGE
jgi:hypothetical protein